MMQTTIEPMSDGIAVVRLIGRLDARAAPTVNAELAAAVNVAGSCLILDMTRVSVIDSTGLSVLLATLKASRRVDGDLWLVAPSQQVRSLLRSTGLNRVFKTYDSLDAVYPARVRAGRLELRPTLSGRDTSPGPRYAGHSFDEPVFTSSK